jgi:hypothetical protein
MKCHKCGYALPEDAVFCLKCGTLVVKEKEKGNAAAGHFLKLSWTEQPMVMASTDDDALSGVILEQWKLKARLPHLVDTRKKDGVTHIWYFPEKLMDILRMKRHKQDIMDMYQNLKEYAIVNGWTLSGPEKTEKSGRDELMALDIEFEKK